MTELQIETSSAEVEQEVASAAPQAEATEQPVQNSESATETPTENNGNVQNRINKLTADKYAEKRRADDLERKIKELESTPATQQSSNETLQAPTLPEDTFDEAAMRQYHADNEAYLLKRAEQIASQSVTSTLDKQRAAEQEQLTAQNHQRIINEYAQNGLRDGLTVEQMQVNEQVLVNSGINSDIGLHIMSDEKGAAIVNHLASNPEALQKLNSMAPMQAAVFIESSVKPSLGAHKVVTSAPDPLQPVAGGGVKEQDKFDMSCPGAQFESS